MIDRDIGFLFWAKVISMLGTWAYAMAAAIAMFVETGSALAVGLVGTFLYLPQVLLGTVVGSLTDRGNVRHLILLGIACMAVSGAALSLCMFIFAPHGSPYVIVVMVCSACFGTGIVISSPAMQTLVPRLVTREELPAAIGLNFAPMTLARIGGPVVGAALIAHGGAVVSFAFTATCQVLALAAAFAVREPKRAAVRMETDYTMRAAVRHVLNDRPLVLILVVAVAITFGSEPSLTLAAPLAHELGEGGTLIGGLSATFGVGALLGLMVNRFLDGQSWADRGVSAALVTMTAGLGCSALSPWVALTLAGFGLAGAGYTIAMSRTATVMMLRVPDLLRGRVMSLWMLCIVGARPVASASVGLVTDTFSARAAVGLMGIVTLSALLLARGRLDVMPGHVA